MRVLSLRRVLIALVLCASARAADAQALGYAIGGPAGYTGFFSSGAGLVHGAGGAEGLFGGRAGAAGEVGILAGSGGGLWVSSIGGIFHVSPVTGARKVTPYVTGGYSYLASGDGSFGAWHAGGGVDVWINRHVGIRAEFRDHVRPDSRGTVQYWALRGGVVFR